MLILRIDFVLDTVLYPVDSRIYTFWFRTHAQIQTITTVTPDLYKELSAEHSVIGLHSPRHLLPYFGII